MSQIIKAFIGIFTVLFMAVCTVGLLGIFFQVLGAQNFQASTLAKMEESDFAGEVLMDVFAHAKERGYEVEICFFPKEEAPFICRNFQEMEAVVRLHQLPVLDMARVELRYPIRVLFLGTDIRQQLIGIAR